MEAPEKPAFSQAEPASAQTRPLTPEEWVQRNFAMPADRPAGQPGALATQPQPDLQSASSNPAAQPAKANPAPVPGAPPSGGSSAPLLVLATQASPPARLPAEAANPAPKLVAQANPTTQAATPAPKLVAQASPPAQPATPAPALLAQPSPPARLPAGLPSSQVQQTNPASGQAASRAAQAVKPEQLLLREGDTVRVTFPGARDLNTVQQIRRDGKITLQLIGEFKAAGLAPSEAEQELIKLYGPQLQVPEVIVELQSSAFAVYVTGSVLRPGKIMSDRPISAMEAVVEAGIDYSKANLKKVRVIRKENGRSEYHILNLREALLGKPAESFDLKPSDIIYVPERFTWF
jgi:polysaccharide export outer membrane protein